MCTPFLTHGLRAAGTWSEDAQREQDVCTLLFKKQWEVCWFLLAAVFQAHGPWRQLRYFCVKINRLFKGKSEEWIHQKRIHIIKRRNKSLLYKVGSSCLMTVSVCLSRGLDCWKPNPVHGEPFLFYLNLIPDLVKVAEYRLSMKLYSSSTCVNTFK